MANVSDSRSPHGQRIFADQPVDFSKTGSFGLKRTASNSELFYLNRSSSKRSESLESREPSVTESELISSQQIQAYSNVFGDIIKQDSLYGGILVNVKQTYDQYIRQIE